MASILPSANISLISGSVGTNTYALSKSGIVVRQKKTTGYIPTPYSSVINTNFTTISQYWGQSLTENERVAWCEAAINWKRKNRVTKTYTSAGFNLFLSLNGKLLSIGEPIITSPPTHTIFPVITNFSLEISISLNRVRITKSPFGLLGNVRFEFWLTSQLSPGIMSWWKYRRLLLTTTNGGLLRQNVFTQYTARFGALQLGKKVFCMIVPINKATGEKGQQLQTFAFVQA